MKDEKKIEILVGTIVFIALLGLVFGLIWGKGENLFETRRQLAARFDDVRGLEPGDPLMVRGIKKGEVRDIILESGYVEVLMWLKADVTLFSDLKICVEDRELMGGKQITVYPGESGERVDYSQIFQGTARSDMMLLMSKVDQMMENAGGLLGRLNALIDSLPVFSTLASIQNAADITANAVRENKAYLNKTVQNLSSLTAQFEEDSVSAQINSLLGNLGQTVQKLDTTAFLLNHALARLKDEQSTAHLLLEERELYDSLMETISGLDSLLADVKRRPKRYFRVSLF